MIKLLRKSKIGMSYWTYFVTLYKNPIKMSSSEEQTKDDGISEFTYHTETQ